MQGSTTGRNVAIVGAGIGGLTAALAFARHGADVTVLEQARALSEVGAGVQITPNGAVALRALGLGPGLAQASVSAEAVVPTDALTGRALARFDLGARAYCFVYRPDLIDLLARACAEAGVVIRTGVAVTGPDLPGLSPDLIVGADGLHSVLRPVLNGADAPFFTGQAAWRAVIPVAGAPPVARIWMAPGQHVVTYPLTGHRLNIVAVREQAEWTPEGWHLEDAPEAMQAAFSGCGAELRGILGQVTQTRLWGLFRHPVAERWHGQGIALLGDAAHPTLPFLAQGANLAIEDAYVLAACWCAADPEAGLARYQALRRPRVARAIAAANANAVNFHLSGARRMVAQAGLRVLGRVAPELFLRRMDWLYAHDVTAP